MSEPSLAPALLLSMPQMNDPNFARTVVLLCQHDADGAFGLVINRPIITTARVIARDRPEDATEHELEVWVGGPVEPERSWILVHDNQDDEDAIRICDGVYLSTSATLLRRILDRSADSRTRLVAGYAGWGPGQLDAEIAASAWLSMSVDMDIVFDTPPEEMWTAAIRRLGATPGGLQTGQGVH
ncbi:MAG TPA: YqgE/AlgH family protein [Vicinamibacterales bacterium]|nr:YqgE/AlgH family protein [Vicinamibacterales bacterium]